MCLWHAAQLERERSELDARGVRLVGVGPGGDTAASAVHSVLRLGYPVIGDARRRVYDRFGFRRVLAVVQESGVALVDAGGTLRFIHRSANPAAALPWGDVVRALDTMAH